MEKICPNCGAKSNENTRFCTKCGTAYLIPEEKHPVETPPTIKARIRYARQPINVFQLLSSFIALAGFGLIGYSLYLFFIGSQPTPTLNQSSAPIVVTASQLINDYASNEVAADQKYQNYYLEISGTVQQISKDFLNNPYIILASSPESILNGVQCSFDADQENELTTLQSGQPITVDGIGNGYILSDVEVKNCSIVPNSPTPQ